MQAARPRCRRHAVQPVRCKTGHLVNIRGARRRPNGAKRSESHRIGEGRTSSYQG